MSLNNSLAIINLLSSLLNRSQNGIIRKVVRGLNVDELCFEVCIDSLNTIKFIQGTSDGAGAS